ncbi:MAG: redoxin domain-containing protein [Pedosphaera sp.]|nr:redoxin domain-containing protein [Pedosphaera sp.]
MKIPLHFFLVALTAFSVGAADTEATKESPNAQPAGHSLHGEAFNEGPRQRAYLMEGMPKIDFPITAKVEAQQFFNQGIGQLHGFWYFEAERSFRQVAALETNCAMAYWGMAMANVNNEKRAKEFIKKAVSLKKEASRRETLWIEALDSFYKDGNSGSKQRHRGYVRSLENIIEEFPEDVEAKAFLVFKIWDNNGRDLQITSYLAIDALANEVLTRNPMHPIHHARIHFWNNEKDARALNSAARCGQTSPGIAHMWHMPGHTYSKLARYADAAWQQEASARVDHAHMIRDRVLPDQIHNYAHNNQWLVEDLEYIGRVHDAVDLAKNLIELPRHPTFNTFSRTNSTGEYERAGGSSSLGRSRLFETLIRYELWDELISLSGTVYLEPTEIPEEQAKRLRGLGLAYFSKSDVENGDRQIAELEALLKKQRQTRQVIADKAEEKAQKEKLSDEKTAKAMADALQAQSNRMKPIEKSLAELRGYAALAKDDKDAAREQFDQVKDLPRERLALIEWQMGDKEKAEKLAREAVEKATNQVQVLANYVDILWRREKGKQAKEAFAKLRAISSYLDLDMPVFRRLKPIAQSVGLPEDWRLPAQVPSDAGERASLASLGPFRWHPSPAPKWTLPGQDGETVSLTDYRGKPVVVIFYLGYGCAHCIEQLNAFAPMAKEFAEAGISLVAISTDSVEGLKKTFAKSKADGALPFPLVSDQGQNTFKAYRAFDDFENIPLHGTFLVDGEGLVRWQDIGYEPFKELKFLLAESKRLLDQSLKVQLAGSSKVKRASASE